MSLALYPIPALTPVQVAALSDSARAQREVDTARNAVIREAQLDGRQIPLQDRATKYASPVLRITEVANRTPDWKAAALAELARTEANKAREAHRAKRQHNRKVASKVARRKQREAKRARPAARRLPSPPHARQRPHSSDEAAEDAEDAVHLGGL